MLGHLAYIDAGTGSIFIQAVFGSLLAGMFIFRRFVARLAAGARKLLRRERPVLETKASDD